MIRLRQLVLVLLVLLAGVARAATPHVKAELVAESGAIVPGSTFWVGLRARIDPHWHIYWLNAGDAGQPTTLTLQLPKGFEAGPLQYPYPMLVNLAGLIGYVYDDEVLLPMQLKAPADLKPGSTVALKAKAAWLVCSDSCMPGHADLELTLPVAAQASPGPLAAEFEKARQALPQKGDGLSASLQGGALVLHFTPPGPLKEAYFFAAKPDLITYAGAQKLSLDSLSLVPAQLDKGVARPSQLEGVLVLTETSGKVEALGVSVPITTGSGATPASGETGTVSSFGLKLPTTGGAPPPVNAPPDTTLVVALLFAFGGGLILNLMPCVFPVLSLKVLGIIEQARQEESKPYKHGLVFTLGVLVSFWLLSGLLIGLRHSGLSIGWGYQLQSPVFVSALACLFFLIGLNLLGVFEVGEELTRLGQLAEGKTGYAESFWSGALATVVATPCSAPFMGTAIGFALTQSDLLAFSVFTALGLGMATPYLLLTSLPQLLRWIPKPGAWMETFKQLMAFPMLATVAWLTWVLGGQKGPDGILVLLLCLVTLGMASWMVGRWGFALESAVRTRSRLGALCLAGLALGLTVHWLRLDDSPTTWQPYDPDKVTALHAQGKPVFVDFTANWCLSCKYNEQFALHTQPVEDRFRQLGMTLMRGDWTKQDPVITQALAHFGRSSVPLYVIYPPKGDPVVLPEVLTKELVLNALDKVQ